MFVKSFFEKKSILAEIVNGDINGMYKIVNKIHVTRFVVLNKNTLFL